MHARHGDSPNERLAGSTLQMALIDYAKQNPSVEVACRAALSKWVEARPHEHRAAAPSSAGGYASQTADNGRAGALLDLAESAASFMVMQMRWIQTMTERPEFDGPTAAAFADGVWTRLPSR